MRLPSHKPGKIFLLLLGCAVFEQRDRIGPHVGIDRKQQPLIRRAVPQPFHNRNGRDRVGAAAAEFFGNRQTMHTERGAFFPSIMREDPLSVAFNHVAAQFGAGKIDRRLLQRQLLGCKIKLHWLIQAVGFRRFRRQSIGEDFGNVAHGHVPAASGNAVRRHS